MSICLLARHIVCATTIFCLLVMNTGCSSLGYYGQAISGHWQLMRARVAIDEVLNDTSRSASLKRKLELVAAARDFASRELLLPDNGSYRSYVDLGRPYVVWNVFAAPELSLKPITSCFLFVGCLTYRGFFSESEAHDFATELRAQGNDVFVAGVAAYSTLGWFDDPVLNTMLLWDDTRIVEVIFHELAHQLTYADDDTRFNESFATALATIGVERFAVSDPSFASRYRERRARESEFYALLLDYRARLAEAFESDHKRADKRAAKIGLFETLLVDYTKLKSTWNGYEAYDEWMFNDLNNAKLSSVATYHDYVPAFRVLFEQLDQDLKRFYATVEELSQATPTLRRQCLDALAADKVCPGDWLK